MLVLENKMEWQNWAIPWFENVLVARTAVDLLTLRRKFDLKLSVKIFSRYELRDGDE